MDILITGAVAAAALAVAVVITRGRGRGSGLGNGDGSPRQQRQQAAKKIEEAESAVLSGNRPLALALLEKAHALDASSVRGRHGLASVLFDEQRYGEADAHLRWIHEQGRGSEATHRLAVLSALNQRDPERAVLAARAGLEDDHDSAMLMHLLGESARQVYAAALGESESNPMRAAHAALRRALTGEAAARFFRVSEEEDEVPLDKQLDQDPAAAERVREAARAIGAYGEQSRPVQAVVSCSTGETTEIESFDDANPAVRAALEVLRNDRIEFVPISELERIVFGPPAPWRAARFTYRSGKEEQGHVPALYGHAGMVALSEPSGPGGTVWRTLTDTLDLPIGERQFRADDQVIRIDTITRIEIGPAG